MVVLNLPSFHLFMGWASGRQSLNSPHNAAAAVFVAGVMSKVTRHELRVLE